MGSAEEARARRAEVERYALDSIAKDHREHVRRAPVGDGASFTSAERHGAPMTPQIPRTVEVRTYFVPPVDPGARRLVPGMGTRRAESQAAARRSPLALVRGLLRRIGGRT
jgi:hypothetical protein